MTNAPWLPGEAAAVILMILPMSAEANELALEVSVIVVPDFDKAPAPLPRPVFSPFRIHHVMATGASSVTPAPFAYVIDPGFRPVLGVTVRILNTPLLPALVAFAIVTYLPIRSV